MERGDRPNDGVGEAGRLTISKERAGWLKMVIANRHVILVFRLTLATFFLVSSYGKLVDIERY